MRRYFVLPAVLCSAFLASTTFAADYPYATAVKSLSPTYYYQLNETDTSGGAVDTMGNGPIGEFNGDYGPGGPEIGVPGPDYLLEGGAWTPSAEWDDRGEELPLVGLGASNTAHASNNTGHITLGDGSLFAANAMSVSLFALGGPANGGDRVFTNNQADPMTSFQIVVGNDGLVVSTNPDLECAVDECGHKSLFLPGEGVEYSGTGADRGLNSADNGWWHIVATTQGNTPEERTENIHLYLNGVDRTEDFLPGTTGWGWDTGLAKIGGRRDDPLDSTTHSGAQDEVAIWLNRVLTADEAKYLYDVAIGAVAPSSPGDYNGDGAVDAADVDLLGAAMRSGAFDAKFDETGDGVVNFDDRIAWVKDIKGTWMGDSNLDGTFDSTDFVVAFTAGKYELAEAAGWEDGDWDGNGLFDSSDFVTAFADGGYEQGPRAAVSA
ncbi:MAG: hypothetical protein KDB23_11615, partial [Planctomycetales bacterium]|nr:hypothetical protein [Planctomycetales bacterium]